MKKTANPNITKTAGRDRSGVLDLDNDMITKSSKASGASGVSGAIPVLKSPSLQPSASDLTSKRPASSEMRPGAGFRVNSDFSRVSAATIAKLSEFETTDISDSLNRMFVFDPAIRNVVNNNPLFGPAVTVKVFPGDCNCRSQ